VCKADWVCRRQGRLRPVAAVPLFWQAGRGVRRRRRALAGATAPGGSRTDRTVAHGLGRGPHGATTGLGGARKRSMLSGSRTRARSFMRPPHAGHWSTVNPNVRRKSSDHPMYRHRLPEGGGLAALVNAGGAGALCGGGGGAGAALADGSAGAGGMISGRQWAAAARTPL